MREIYKYSNMANQKNLSSVIDNYYGRTYNVWSGNVPPTYNLFGNQAMFLIAQQYWQENGTRGSKEDFKKYEKTRSESYSSVSTPPVTETDETETEQPAKEATGKFDQEGGVNRMTTTTGTSRPYGDAPLGLPTFQSITGSPMIIEGQETFVEGEPAYGFESDFTQWNSYKTVAEIDNVKFKLWKSGFYPKGMAPKLDGFKSEEDFAAMRRAMNFANANTRTIDQAFAERMPLAPAGGTYRSQVTDNLDGSKIEPFPQKVITDMNDPYYKLQEFVQRNNLDVSEEWLNTNADRVRKQGIKIDDVKNFMREKYISKQYPAWAADILGGKDVYELAEPYISEYAKTLELDKGSVKLTDPYIMKALDNVDSNGKPSYLPMVDFKQLLKSDDAWFFTKQANSEYEGLANKILKSFGIQGDI